MELVERLREQASHFRDGVQPELAPLVTEAADLLEEALKALGVMVYETTHLSPMEVDGSHWCRISAAALQSARAAIAKAKGGVK